MILMKMKEFGLFLVVGVVGDRSRKMSELEKIPQENKISNQIFWLVFSILTC